MKRIICLILCLVLTLGIFGCAKEPDAPESSTPENSESNGSENLAQGKTVACCMGSVAHPIYRVVQYGFCTKAEELGMVPIVSGLDEGMTQEHIDKWNSDIAEFNVAGIMLWTGDDSCYEMMKTLKEQGVYTVVPHFIHSYEHTKSFIDKNIAYSEKQYSAEMVDYILDKLTESGITEGSIGISFIGPGVPSGIVAMDNFIEIMAEKAPNFTVLSSLMEGGEVTYATDKITDYIESNPDMVAAIGLTGYSALSWTEARANTGREDIIVIGLDCTEANINTVLNGKIDALVATPWYGEGAACATALNELVNGIVFNSSEDTWLEFIEAPLATLDGEGENNIQTYLDIYNSAQEYFKE